MSEGIVERKEKKKSTKLASRAAALMRKRRCKPFVTKHLRAVFQGSSTLHVSGPAMRELIRYVTKRTVQMLREAHDASEHCGRLVTLPGDFHFALAHQNQ